MAPPVKLSVPFVGAFRSWKKARPAVDPDVGAEIFTLAPPLIEAVAYPAPVLLVRMIVAPLAVTEEPPVMLKAPRSIM